MEGAAPMEGRTCLVTGATSGIGLATALGLARMGATVVMAVRDPHKGGAVRGEIVRASGNPRVDLLRVDLASQASIREFVAAFSSRYPQLHILVNNAGIFTTRSTLTVDGFESTFAVNHLGPFLLTNLLLDRLRASAPSRIVVVASNAHWGARLDFEDLQGEGRFRGFRAYARSKLANLLFTYELARRLEGTGVTVNAVHPGVVRTGFARNSGPLLRALFSLVGPFMRSPARGAETVLYLAAAPRLEGITGMYFVDRAPARSSPLSHDEGVARRLWEVSARLTGLAPGSTPGGVQPSQ